MPDAPPLTTEDDRFQVKLHRNTYNQTGYLIVDTWDDERPFAAVLPEDRGKPNYQSSRERRAYALCDEINEHDRDIRAEMEKLNDAEKEEMKSLSGEAGYSIKETPDEPSRLVLPGE